MTKPNALIKRQTVECGDMQPVYVSKDAWTRLIEHPMIIDDKAKAPLIIWGKMPETVELSFSGRPRCIKENLDYITVLQIDYDDGLTIDEFVQKYKDYRFDLYTSYNYGFKPNDRFRVMLPLPERIYMKHICPPTKELLTDAFPGVDSTCFDKCHWQVLPAVRSADAPYRVVRNQGKLLDLFPVSKFEQLADDWDTYHKLNQQIHELDKVGKAPPKERNPHAKALEWAQQQIDETPEGQRNREFYRILMWLKNKVECDLYEVCDLVWPADMEDEMQDMVARLFNS